MALADGELQPIFCQAIHPLPRVLLLRAFLNSLSMTPKATGSSLNEREV